MRKLNITDYKVEVFMPTDKENIVKEEKIDFPIKKTIIDMLFQRELRLDMMATLKQKALAVKIMECEEPEILLEDEEFDRIHKAFDTYKGYTQYHAELIERVVNAEKVEAQEKSKGA